MSTLQPGLIVNADDLGIHPDINAGILSAYQHGFLSSCTMLMTTQYFEQTVLNFVRPGLLPIGIHLSLTLGKAVAPLATVPDLVDEQGNLKLSAGQLIVASMKRNHSLASQIRQEFEAQLARASDSGIRATHADSHQHVHMNPVIFAILEEALPRFGIRRLRYSRELLPTFIFASDPAALVRRFNFVKWTLLRWRSIQIRPRLASNDEFFGVLYSGTVTKKALAAAIARAATTRCTEIGIHPGFPAPRTTNAYPRASYNNFISSHLRQVEHDILLDTELAELIARSGRILRAFDGREKRYSDIGRME